MSQRVQSNEGSGRLEALRALDVEEVSAVVLMDQASQYQSNDLLRELLTSKHYCAELKKWKSKYG